MEKRQVSTMSADEIKSLITQLSNKYGDVREKARLALVGIGKEATTPLTEILAAQDQQTRWEAAKALGAIADPSSIPALIKILEDNVFDIRWLAAQALIAIGTESIVPLLEALSKSSDELFLREEAHHVIKYIFRDNPKAKELYDILKPVVDALEGSVSRIETPGAARTVLEKLKRMKGTL
jgi:HEAT repeat protein